MNRFQRQELIFGSDGQSKIGSSRIAVVGLGGLGCNVITHLASAGVGNMTIVDDQTVEISNLNRQFVYSKNDIGHPKSEISKEWIERIFDCNVTAYNIRITDSNSSVLKGNDIIIDCLDNNSSRLSLNRFAVMNGIPIVHGGVDSMFGQVSVIIPGLTPCLECILPKDRERIVPSLGSTVAFVASLQATEAIKMITGIGTSLAGKLLTADLSDNSYSIYPILKKDDCPVCGAKD